jgi:hypothetical protein
LSANQKSAVTKVKIKALDFPDSVACEKTTPSEIDSAGPAAEDTRKSPHADLSTAQAAAQDTGTAPMETLAAGIENLDVNDDNKNQQANCSIVESNGALPESAESQPGIDASSAATKEHEASASSVESTTESIVTQPMNDDIDMEKSDESVTPAVVVDSKDNATPSNGMKEINTSSKRPKLSPPRTLEMTLFDRLEKMYGAGIKRLLAVQYR